MRLALIVSLLVALLAVVFALQNPGPMSINLPFTDARLESTQPVVLISTLLIGLLIGVLASLPGRIATGLRARKAEKKLEELSGGSASPPPQKVKETASTPESSSASSSSEAEEMQRLADEVARRTSSEIGQQPPQTPNENAG
ncbi:MAG: lipopolysaccharide assembly protein LapA domain-containing protein [Rubricoccaceae bacterium]|nr:lipopolysaccharide assembly protein LapA domain-containing protein [Rubricoccaceae bacterium]